MVRSITLDGVRHLGFNRHWGCVVALLRREREVFLKIKQNKGQWVDVWVVTTLYQGTQLMFVTLVFGTIKTGTLT